MEYSINELAKIAGISTRTLRYYDQIGLLTPTRGYDNGYRIYGQNEVDCLQHILFYREMGVSLEDIKKILLHEDFDRVAALEAHLEALHAKHRQLDVLIANVEKSIMAMAMKGGIKMNDNEKFDGFVERLIAGNESEYGEEIRAKHGDAAVDASNDKLRGINAMQFAQIQELEKQLNAALVAAYAQGDPTSELAQKTYGLHKRWLCAYWPEYSKEAHMGVVQMYVDDTRFTAYYDKIALGSAIFLRDAVAHFSL